MTLRGSPASCFKIRKQVDENDPMLLDCTCEKDHPEMLLLLNSSGEHFHV